MYYQGVPSTITWEKVFESGILQMYFIHMICLVILVSMFMLKSHAILASDHGHIVTFKKSVELTKFGNKLFLFVIIV